MKKKKETNYTVEFIGWVFFVSVILAIFTSPTTTPLKFFMVASFALTLLILSAIGENKDD